VGETGGKHALFDALTSGRSLDGEITVEHVGNGVTTVLGFLPAAQVSRPSYSTECLVLRTG
jgi:hypothetical protein